jgi:hypothetical protein
MATSPQTSASQYLSGMHAERRTVSRARASTAPHLKNLRDPQEENIWEELRESEVPKKKKAAGDLWRPGPPAIEAAALSRLIGKNGDSIDDLRALIGVSPEEKNELDLWCLREPRLKRKIEGMVYFRELVLAAFNSLVENDAALRAVGVQNVSP